MKRYFFIVGLLLIGFENAFTQTSGTSEKKETEDDKHMAKITVYEDFVNKLVRITKVKKTGDEKADCDAIYEKVAELLADKDELKSQVGKLAKAGQVSIDSLKRIQRDTLRVKEKRITELTNQLKQKEDKISRSDAVLQDSVGCLRKVIHQLSDNLELKNKDCISYRKQLSEDSVILVAIRGDLKEKTERLTDLGGQLEQYRQNSEKMKTFLMVCSRNADLCWEYFQNTSYDELDSALLVLKTDELKAMVQSGLGTEDTQKQLVSLEKGMKQWSGYQKARQVLKQKSSKKETANAIAELRTLQSQLSGQEEHFDNVFRLIKLLESYEDGKSKLSFLLTRITELKEAHTSDRIAEKQVREYIFSIVYDLEGIPYLLQLLEEIKTTISLDSGLDLGADLSEIKQKL